MELNENIVEKVKKLEDKFAAMGQDLNSYLDGLLYADYLGYWDYVDTDVLLDLQKPRTSFPDEMIFILYHQITELYFKLTLHAIDQIHQAEDLTPEIFQTQIKRIDSYFRNLVWSFEIMIDGMDMEQFRKFRMSLLPASGFQSAQYRFIELACTDLNNLLAKETRKELENEDSVDVLMDNLYWKKGATELATGKKTLTLKRFEKKYADDFKRRAIENKNQNLNSIVRHLAAKHDLSDELIEDLRKLDLNANVYWPLMHVKAAASYLQRKPDVIAATGGTNWQDYLPPSHQFISFFPQLFSEEELSNWGRNVDYKKLIAT
ncbi:MAG: tryptophan 2,3-dioxygenase [Chitinophagales bacterium]|nr:tryptophan 2,3-dioxygenase [Chitinophagales bacterium]